jgi:hypothetical protein
VDRYEDEWTDRWINVQGMKPKTRKEVITDIVSYFKQGLTDKGADIKRDRYTDGLTDKGTDIQRDRNTDGLAYSWKTGNGTDMQ